MILAQPVTTAVSGAPILLTGGYDLSEVGYAASEFFVSGEASSYAVRGPCSEDGIWSAEPAAAAAYTTRIVVLAPIDPKRFNGSVLVEWLNVTGGIDSPAVWLMAHREMVRAGYIFVAVSAQKVGVEGGESVMGATYPLKALNPERYGSLSHPGDAFSYDIFSDVGRLVRASGILGDHIAERVIGVGESQSASFLTTYVNAIDPIAKVYDGFLIHSRFGGASTLDGALALVEGAGHVNVRLRPDVRVPVLTFICESDLVGFRNYTGFHASRAPDSDTLHTWEVPGAAHADNYTLIVSQIDTGAAPIEQLAAAYAPTKLLFGQEVEKPINFGPQHHYVIQAALHGLERWVRTGEAPAMAPRIALTKAEPPKLMLDEHGMAQGGIRTPWLDVPTARLSSDGNPGNLMAAIFGTGEMFPPAKLNALYPGGKTEYLARFAASLDQTIARGFILAADRKEILDLAAFMYPDKSWPKS